MRVLQINTKKVNKNRKHENINGNIMINVFTVSKIGISTVGLDVYTLSIPINKKAGIIHVIKIKTDITKSFTGSMGKYSNFLI